MKQDGQDRITEEAPLVSQEPAIVTFDYAFLDTDTQAFVRQRTNATVLMYQRHLAPQPRQEGTG